MKALDRLPTLNGTRNPDQQHNVGALIGDAYFWDTVQDLAASKSRSAWSTLEKEGFIQNKDDIRNEVDGEKTLVHSPSFAVIAKVSNPRASFDKDAFITLVSSKFKIDKHKLVELAQDCTKQSKAPVSLKILEI